MKSQPVRILQFVTGNVSLALLVLLTFVVGFASASARAQGGAWLVDEEHSIARLSLGSGSQSAEVGVAPVRGSVIFDSSDSARPVIDLNFKSDKTLGPNSSEIRFRSKRSVITSDGKQAIVGDLSVSRVERSVTSDPNEAYHGAEYGDPAVYTDSHEVILVFPGASLPAAKSGAIELSASITVNREGFPPLLAALESGNWPGIVVEDEYCTLPSTVGDDYSGPICTGTQVASVTNSVLPATGSGEGYYGFDAAVVPDTSQATIALTLNLTQATPTAATISGAAESGGH